MNEPPQIPRIIYPDGTSRPVVLQPPAKREPCKHDCGNQPLPDGTIVAAPRDISARRDWCRCCEHATKDATRPREVLLLTQGLTSESECLLCRCNISQMTKIAAKACPDGRWPATIDLATGAIIAQTPRPPVNTKPKMTTKQRIAERNAAKAAPLLILTLLLALRAAAQDATPEGGGTNTVEEASAKASKSFLEKVGLDANAGTNFWLVGYATLTRGENAKLSTGGGVALAYEVSKNFVAAFRGDYLNQDFYQVSINAQLQLPVHIGPVELIPFAVAGVATPFGGGNSASSHVQGIAGAGAALRFGKPKTLISHFLLLGDAEKWSATDGVQYRVGGAAQLSFK
jgi:hypothetical protein